MYILRALVFLFLAHAVLAQQPTPNLPDAKLTPGDTFDVTTHIPAIKIECVARSYALDSMYESARWFACDLPRPLCLCALGACPGGFLFWSAFILSVVRRLLRLSCLRVLRLLSGLLRLWLGRLLSA